MNLAEGVAPVTPSVFLRTLAVVGLFGLGCSPSDSGGSDTDGGQCVPGAMAMCWCDGETPGVQTCQPDMTFAACVCNGTPDADSSGTGASTEPSSSTTDESSASTTAEDATTERSGPDDETSTEGSDTSSSDSSSTDTCTDERYAYYQACIGLADHSPATEFYETCIQACPSAADTCGYSACTTQCSLDTPTPPEVRDCRDAYPECVYAVISEDLEACYTACTEQQQACAEETTCTGEGGSTYACFSLHDGCRESCETSGSPSDGWSSASDGTCSGNESLALLLCRNATTVSDCLTGCDAGTPDCGYNDCLASCYADDYAAEVGCESTWADCPSTNPACISQCYADEATCITECANVATCGAARTDCLTAC
ncbi:MAG: hypothetical protein ACE37F_25215 [Nannocystaceae bacterium]|nr:hypothetical protein [bacterium]